MSLRGSGAALRRGVHAPHSDLERDHSPRRRLSRRMSSLGCRGSVLLHVTGSILLVNDVHLALTSSRMFDVCRRGVVFAHSKVVLCTSFRLSVAWVSKVADGDPQQRAGQPRAPAVRVHALDHPRSPGAHGLRGGPLPSSNSPCRRCRQQIDGGDGRQHRIPELH